MIKKPTKFAIIALIWTAVIVSWIDRGKTPDEKIFPIKFSEIREKFARKETGETKGKVEIQPRPVLTQQTETEPEERYKKLAKEKSARRQTVFNDENYTPRELDNVVSAPLIGTYKEDRIKAPVRKRTNIVTNEIAKWKWESVAVGTGGRKKTIGGVFHYQIINGKVDTASVCRNETYGSIRYRDCRKAAKKYFSEQCRKGNRVACTGENMIP